MMADDGSRYQQFSDQQPLGASQSVPGQPSTSSSISTSSFSQFLNLKFFLRIVEWIFSIVVFAAVSGFAEGAYGFSIFVGVFAFLFTIFFMVAYIVGQKLGTLHSLLPAIETISGVFFLVCFLISGIVAAVSTSELSAYYAGGGATAAFSFFSLFPWSYSTYLAYTEYKSGQSPSGQPTVSV